MKKRKDGLYQICETVTVYGERKRKVFYGKTQAEAKAKRDAFMRQSDPDTVTFQDVYKQYKRVEEARIAYSEFRLKTQRIEQFASIFPVKLQQITPQMISVELNKIAVFNPTTHKPTAKRTLTRYLAAVSNVFEFAISERVATYNPCRYVKPPQNAPQSERDALSPAEYQIILDSTDPRFLAAQIMILCGLRRGELAALTYGDISDTISVTKAYDFKTGRIKPPKSKAGIREVPIPAKIKSALLQLKAEHKDADYVISVDGKQLTSCQWQLTLNYIVRRTGFKFTWHQLRHTYATILYDAGVDVLSAQKFLGHADVKITLGIYTSLSEKKKQTSIDSLDSFLS